VFDGRLNTGGLLFEGNGAEQEAGGYG